MTDQIADFDHVVLGGGKGGKSLAVALGNAGHHVALIEQAQIGGTCINVACIPTKTMVASAKLIELASRAADFGVDVPPAGPSIAGVVDRKRSVVKGMVDAHWKLFTGTPNMTFLFGTGKFVGPRTIEVSAEDGSTSLVRGGRVYINTGSSTTIPPIPGLATVPYLTSTSIMELEELPTRLAIIGAGYIALEFAQMFRRLGSEVAVVQRGARFLPREDPDIADEVRKVLQEDGIEFLDDAETDFVTAAATGIELTYSRNARRDTLQCSHLLVAVGRTLNTAGLGLDAGGVQVSPQGAIVVNDRLETTAENVYAIGDCNGGPLFTHASWDDYRILLANVLYGAGRTTAGRLMPYTLFIDPELGRVGLTEEQALAQGYQIAVASLTAAKIPRANTAGETKGVLKAVVERETGQILGCSLFCHSAGEIMSVVQMAMRGKVPYTEVRDTIFTHPTMAESLNLLFAAL
ncbi:mercuric reductase [Mycobacterium sp. 050128]|uniref:mercuric reductase n=1 Tax=Mycobacterium sp. 050128 TaxID=3096112 RepID=UPI002EDA0709